MRPACSLVIASPKRSALLSAKEPTSRRQAAAAGATPHESRPQTEEESMITEAAPPHATPASPRSSRTPPMMSGGLPVLGHAIAFGRDAMGLLRRAREECGDVAGFKLAHKQMFLLTGTAA